MPGRGLGLLSDSRDHLRFLAAETRGPPGLTPLLPSDMPALRPLPSRTAEGRRAAKSPDRKVSVRAASVHCIRALRRPARRAAPCYAGRPPCPPHRQLRAPALHLRGARAHSEPLARSAEPVEQSSRPRAAAAPSWAAGPAQGGSAAAPHAAAAAEPLWPCSPRFALTPCHAAPPRPCSRPQPAGPRPLLPLPCLAFFGHECYSRTLVISHPQNRGKPRWTPSEAKQTTDS